MRRVALICGLMTVALGLGPSAAQQFVGYLGFFDGDAPAFHATPLVEQACRYVVLMNGRDMSGVRSSMSNLAFSARAVNRPDLA